MGTCSKVAWENDFLALGVCFPQPCSCAGRRFAASRSSLQYYRRIISFPQESCYRRYSQSHLGVILERSKLKARTSFLPRFSENRHASFEIWTLKQHSKMSPQVGLAVPFWRRRGLDCRCIFNRRVDVPGPWLRCLMSKIQIKEC